MSAEGVKRTRVPLGSSVSSTGDSSTRLPIEKQTRLHLPSRKAMSSNDDESALTALMPTPLRPTDFLKAAESYLAPVFIFEHTSTTLPSGMPRPKSRTDAETASTSTMMRLPKPIIYSSMELSMTSLRST